MKSLRRFPLGCALNIALSFLNWKRARFGLSPRQELWCLKLNVRAAKLLTAGDR